MKSWFCDVVVIQKLLTASGDPRAVCSVVTGMNTTVPLAAHQRFFDFPPRLGDPGVELLLVAGAAGPPMRGQGYGSPTESVENRSLRKLD